MSTVDMVSQVGGTRRTSSTSAVAPTRMAWRRALEVINLDPSVRAILVNIFGGIVRCDEVARGIVSALDKVDITSQIVLRLDGTTRPRPQDHRRARIGKDHQRADHAECRAGAR